jgi:fructokinase
MQPRDVRIGVDLGGTKIEAVVVEVGQVGLEATPRELARARVATERDGGYDHVLERTRALVLEAARRAGVDPSRTPIGVGMPGATTQRRPDGTRSEEPLVKNSNTTCLNGRPFRGDLRRALAPAEVVFANDANCFALAEATWGAARGARVTFGVILGTGVGGGVVLATAPGAAPRAWDGAQGIAGEWGHVRLEPAGGPPCYCGARGCVETYLSGPAIEAEYERRAGRALALRDIAAAASAGKSADPIATALVAERVDLFGRALATVLCVIDPDVVVLGGGVSNVDALYDEGPKAVGRWIFNDEVTTRIVRHALGDSAGVLGAALLS